MARRPPKISRTVQKTHTHLSVRLCTTLCIRIVVVVVVGVTTSLVIRVCVCSCSRVCGRQQLRTSGARRRRNATFRVCAVCVCVSVFMLSLARARVFKFKENPPSDRAHNLATVQNFKYSTTTNVRVHRRRHTATHTHAHTRETERGSTTTTAEEPLRTCGRSNAAVQQCVRVRCRRAAATSPLASPLLAPIARAPSVSRALPSRRRFGRPFGFCCKLLAGQSFRCAARCSLA